MDKVTENFGVLVLDNTKRSNDVQELISWYRANPHPPDYKIGADVFWAMSAATAKSDAEVEHDMKERERGAVGNTRRAGRKVSVQQLDEDGHVVHDDLELV